GAGEAGTGGGDLPGDRVSGGVGIGGGGPGGLCPLCLRVPAVSGYQHVWEGTGRIVESLPEAASGCERARWMKRMESDGSQSGLSTRKGIDTIIGPLAIGFLFTIFPRTDDFHAKPGIFPYKSPATTWFPGYRDFLAPFCSAFGRRISDGCCFFTRKGTLRRLRVCLR